MHIYIVFFLLLLLLIGISVGFLLSNLFIQLPDGSRVTGAWPKQFTEAFAQYIDTSGAMEISMAGREALDQYGLRCRVLDDKGNELTVYGSHDANATVLESVYATGDAQGRYQIGFPVHVTSVTMYLNGERFTSGRAIILPIVVGGILLVSLAGFVYGLWITRQLRQVTGAVEEIAARTYQHVDPKGILGDVTRSLNQLENDIQTSDTIRAETERQRIQWISGITHDLKTPLSPIRGYAELLAEPGIPPDQARHYAQIILKNTDHAQRLIDDMKTIYQMESGMMPVQLKRVELIRYVKEFVIEVLNTPEYRSCSIHFEHEVDAVYAFLDDKLLRRALMNIVINAVTHNPKSTEVTVSVKKRDEVSICISDNGKGITAVEADRLFDRYYRGGNMDERPEGTGLGLAIARQIVELHGGSIWAQGEAGRGTCIVMGIPEAAN